MSFEDSADKRPPKRKSSRKSAPHKGPGNRNHTRRNAGRPRKGWDSVAAWYDGWVGHEGSEHHRKLALPTLLELLALQSGEHLLDIGAGQGVLAPYAKDHGAVYTGVEISPRLLDLAKAHHGDEGRFIEGDACQLDAVPGLNAASFDAVAFLLSIQDINPLEDALGGAAWALKPGGRLVLLMTHPCFRVPRQSGWGFDEGRKLRFRRVDRYLNPLKVPMKAYSGGSGVTVSFHRPMNAYVNCLGENGLLVDRIVELPSLKAQRTGQGSARSENASEREFPLFLGLRAWKYGG